jgi:hypothetical protein
LLLAEAVELGAVAQGDVLGGVGDGAERAEESYSGQGTAGSAHQVHCGMWSGFIELDVSYDGGVGDGQGFE